MARKSMILVICLFLIMYTIIFMPLQTIDLNLSIRPFEIVQFVYPFRICILISLFLILVLHQIDRGTRRQRPNIIFKQLQKIYKYHQIKVLRSSTIINLAYFNVQFGNQIILPNYNYNPSHFVQDQMQTSQIFSLSISRWSTVQKQQIQIFFLFNQFFSKFYQQRKFQQIASMCYFRIIKPKELLTLQNNNRPEAVILLSGQILIKKKQNQNILKRKHKSKQKIQTDIPHQMNKLRNIGKCTKYNQVFRLNSQCSLQSIGQSPAEIIFVPCSLYNRLIQKIQLQRVQKIQIVLARIFTQLRKKDLRLLSQTNCLFKQFRMNNCIYRASDKPQEAYILLQGMIKLEKPGFSHKKMLQTIIINPQRIFGQKDINSQERQHSAVCCSAHVQILSIPKNSFLQYAGSIYLEQKDLVKQNRKSLNLPRTMNLRINHKRLRYLQDSIDLSQNQKSSKQKSRQYQLVKNSHMLLDISPKNKKKFSLKSTQLQNQLPQFKQIIKHRNKMHRNIKQNKNQFKLDDSLQKQLGLHK